MRPIPHCCRRKILPFSGLPAGERFNGDRGKANVSVASLKHNVVGTASVTQRKPLPNSMQAQQIISLNPLPMKKHGCDRPPIRACSEVCCLVCTSSSVFGHCFVCLVCYPCQYHAFCDPDPVSDIITMLMQFIPYLIIIHHFSFWVFSRLNNTFSGRRNF